MKLSLVEEVHRRLKQEIGPGDLCLDATAGNGFDTLFLARQVATEGMVHAMDLQRDALRITQSLLERHGLEKYLSTYQSCHSQIDAVLPTSSKGRIRAVTFNLGYLPKGDKSIKTNTVTTLKALRHAYDWLQEKGMISVLCYVGHPGGRTEEQSVRKLIEERGWQSETIAGNDSKESPILHWIEKT